MNPIARQYLVLPQCKLIEIIDIDLKILLHASFVGFDSSSYKGISL